MITYELTKELKDNGFPQKGTWEDHEGLKYWSTYDGGASKNKPKLIAGSEANFGFMEDLYYIPTLSELIEACGDRFGRLWKGNRYWLAGGGEPDYDDIWQFDFAGNIPKEAVAKLYIALNKK